MKKSIYKSITVIVATAVAAQVLLAGCGQNTGNNEIKSEDTASVARENSNEPKSAEAEKNEDAKQPKAPYFTKGVYVNYAAEAQDPPRTYFYVFSGDDYGFTDDGEVGIGLPFDAEQGDGTVEFTFGGAGEEKNVFVVNSVEEGVVKGYFEDIPDRELVFEPVLDADPENFDAYNYVNGPENCMYHDPNGWSIKYNSDLFTINQEDNNVFIVYTGESAGTNMITVTYTADNKAEAAIKELGESWGGDTAYSEGPFPGAKEDVVGYRASLPASEEGSGLYMEALGRDYMDGALIFELTGHMSGDDELDMEVSDRLAGIIDSLTFEFEE